MHRLTITAGIALGLVMLCFTLGPVYAAHMVPEVQHAKAGLPSPDGTPLLLVHGFSDTCEYAFYKTQSPNGGPNAVDTTDYMLQHGWKTIDHIGYYNQNYTLNFTLPNGQKAQSSDRVNPLQCDHNVQDLQIAQQSGGTIKPCGAYSNGKDGTVDDSIRHLACLFAWHVYSTYTQHGQSVNILAHSMGGLVVRDAIGETTNHVPGFPPAPLAVNRVVTVATPHGGVGGTYHNLAFTFIGDSQELEDMNPGSSFMNTIANLQAPQGSTGTFWGLISASDECIPSPSGTGGHLISCAVNTGIIQYPYGDGVVAAESALAMKANTKVLYGVVTDNNTNTTYTADTNTQYQHEGHSCGQVFNLGNFCLQAPFYLNDGTPGSQQTRAWLCISNCTKTDFSDMNIGSTTAHPVLYSLAQIAALLAPPNLYTYVASNSDGRLEVFNRGADGNIWHDYQTSPGNSWSNWSVLQNGQSFNGDPAVGQDLDGRLEVFARNTLNNIAYNYQVSPGGGWHGWQTLSQSNSFQGTPAIGRNQSGNLEIFARGKDNNVWHNYQTSPGGTWSGWSAVQNGYGFNGDPVLGQNVDGRLEVFALGTDNNIWHNYQMGPGQWSGWVPLQGGQFFHGGLAVARNSDGRLEAYALDTHNSLVHNYQLAQGWENWSPVQLSANSAVFSNAPAVGMNGDGRLEAFAIEAHAGDMWHDFQSALNGGWGNWTTLQSGHGFIDTPAVGNDSDGRLEVFAQGTDGNIWQNYVKVGGGWNGWHTLQNGNSFQQTTPDPVVLCAPGGGTNWTSQNTSGTSDLCGQKLCTKTVPSGGAAASSDYYAGGLHNGSYHIWVFVGNTYANAGNVHYHVDAQNFSHGGYINQNAATNQWVELNAFGASSYTPNGGLLHVSVDNTDTSAANKNCTPTCYVSADALVVTPGGAPESTGGSPPLNPNPLNDYPWNGLTTGGDGWGMGYGQCVSYTAWKIYQNVGGTQHPNAIPARGWMPTDASRSPVTPAWGNANNWAAYASGHGIVVNHTPRVGDIAQWATYSGFPVGHVAYVYQVNADGSIDLAQYNLRENEQFSTLHMPPGGTYDTSFGYGAFFVPFPENFIHAGD